MSVQILFVHALSPLHAGTGQSLGAIDLAIARDRATGFPYLPGTSLKGALRDRCQQQNSALVVPAFGPESKNASEHAGALVFGDANLLLLPVRSLAGTFAWVTSPYLLDRFRRDCREAGLQLPQVRAPLVSGCFVAAKTALKVKDQGKERVIFEDLDCAVEDVGKEDPVGDLARWLAERLFPEEAKAKEGERPFTASLESRLCVVSDEVMSFLAEHGTDVVARVALKADTKTVDNLWHEESLPTETVLVALIHAAPVPRTGKQGAELLREFAPLCKDPIQLGGKATVGRGRCQLVLGGRP